MGELNLTHSNGNQVKLSTPDSLSGNVNFKLPSDHGTTGAFLHSDGSGSLAFGEIAPSNRNVIINGDAKISQRATTYGSITSGGYYAVDRWYVTMDTAGTWTMYQDADVPSGYGFSKSVSLDVNTANTSLSAGSRAMLSYRLEGQDVQRFCKGTANAKKYAVSFWVKCRKTGTYVLELFDHDNSRHICKTYTISSADVWEQKKLVFDNETSNPFDNDNGKSLELQFYLAAGSNYTSGTLATSWASNTNANRAVGQVNVADSTSNKFFLTGVQLEVSANTSFEHRSFGDELLRCQRYCFVSEKFGTSSGAGNSALGINYTGYQSPSNSWVWVSVPFPVTMRAAPTVNTSDQAGNTGNKHSIWTSTGGQRTNNVSNYHTTSFKDHFTVSNYNEQKYGIQVSGVKAEAEL